MFSKPLAFGLVALGCLTAAAGGAYVATRHNAAEVRATAPASATVQAPATPADPGVRETEAAVTPAATPAGHAAAAKPAATAQEPAPPTRDARASSEADAAPKPREHKPASPSKPAADAATRQPARTVPLTRAVAAPPSTVGTDPAAAPVAPLPPSSAPVDPPKSDPIDAPRAPQFDELVLPAASVIGLQLETALTSERARVEDRVEARVTRDVLVDGRLAIPAGARVLGSVTQVDRGGKLKERARLAIRFHTLVLGDGSEIGLRTEPITRDGEPPAADSSKKIGGAAVGGAILGAILGGGKGAMIGGMAGAGGGTAMVMAGDRNPATFQPGTVVTARLATPVTIEVRRERQ